MKIKKMLPMILVSLSSCGDPDYEWLKFHLDREVDCAPVLPLCKELCNYMLMYYRLSDSKHMDVDLDSCTDFLRSEFYALQSNVERQYAIDKMRDILRQAHCDNPHDLEMCQPAVVADRFNCYFHGACWTNPSASCDEWEHYEE